MTERTARRGRRSGPSDTRERIVAEAGRLFAEEGYDSTSMRSVARAAGVDPRMVHYYFSGKAALFAEVMQIPLDPAAVVDRVVGAPRDQVGEYLARAFLSVWDSPRARERFVGLMSAAATHEDAARTIREFVGRELFGRLILRLADTERMPMKAEIEVRASLAAAQMVGLGLLRYVVRHPPLVEASAEELVRLVAPTLQHYLVD